MKTNLGNKQKTKHTVIKLCENRSVRGIAIDRNKKTHNVNRIRLRCGIKVEALMRGMSVIVTKCFRALILDIQSKLCRTDVTAVNIINTQFNSHSH